MREIDELFDALSRSAFRSRFLLAAGRQHAFSKRGWTRSLSTHAISYRSGWPPGKPANDGRQTPMRNHPAFIAQHATATCCRGCLEKWH